MLPIVIWAVVISAAFVYEFREIYGANDMGEYHTELCSYRDELFPPDLAVVTKQLETPKRGDDEQKKLQGRGT
jgi:hypothetical protein